MRLTCIARGANRIAVVAEGSVVNRPPPLPGLHLFSPEKKSIPMGATVVFHVSLPVEDQKRYLRTNRNRGLRNIVGDWKRELSLRVIWICELDPGDG